MVLVSTFHIFHITRGHFTIVAFVFLSSDFFALNSSILSVFGRFTLDRSVISGVFVISSLACCSLISFFACAVEAFFDCCFARASSCACIASFVAHGRSHFTLTNDSPPLLSPAPEMPRLTFF